jgi:hypothetical protein
MSKRITSFLLGALAVVLLGVPAQAQQIRKATPNAQRIAATYVKQIVRTSQDIVDLLSPDLQKKAAAAADLEKQRDGKPASAPKGLTWKLNGNASSMAFSTNHAPVFYQAKDLDMRKTGETIDEYGIITNPAQGEKKYYNRSGYGFYVSNQQLYIDAQEGVTTMVETADGEVYIKDFICFAGVGTWVKGTIEGNTITIPMNQVVYFMPTYGYGLRLGVCSYNEAEDAFVEVAADNVTLTVDAEGNITLEGTGDPEEGGNFVALFYTDDNTFSGYGDYETVFTYDPDYEAPEEVTIPDGLETVEFRMNAMAQSQNGASPVSGKCNVGFDGDNVYVQGLFGDFPNTWIKGTKDGNIYNFPAFQYLGAYGTYDIWLLGATYDEVEDGYVLGDFMMTYDAEANKLTALNDVLANAATDRIYYLSWYSNLTLKGPSDVEEVAETGAPIDEIPYANGFDTVEEQNAFGIIDSNEDGSTWDVAEGTDNSYYRYKWNSNNDANDWLFSPAIKLEAGVNYHFAIDAWAQGASFPERLEVMMGVKAAASAMTQTIIEATDITWIEPQAVENMLFTVEETGYYHFGIHAISDYDEYYLNVDNFLVNEGINSLAPATITDLSVESDGVTAAATITFTAPATNIDGDPLTDNLTVTLFRDGEILKVFEDVAPGTKEVYKDETVSLGTHIYQAVAANEFGEGVKSAEVAEFISAIIQVPFIADFTDSSMMELFNIIDANEDGKTWGWSSSYGAYYGYSSSNSADDYLVTMPIALKAGKPYNFIVNAAGSSAYPERFEVLMGKEATVEGLTKQVIGETVLDTNDFADYEQEISVEEDGNYFFAIHAISDADMFNLKVRSITIEAGLDVTAPAAPKVAVQPDPYGAHKAVVTVTAPRLAANGSTLSNIGKLVVYRDGKAVQEWENVQPEATKVFVDYNVVGTHKYQAIPYNADGGRGVKSEVVSTYVGLDRPADVANLKVAESVMGVVLNWDAPAVGANGGIIDKDGLEYNVYTAHIESIPGWGDFIVMDDIVATTNETMAVVSYDNTVAQHLEYLCVTAKNEIGETSGVNAVFFAGAPDQMPFEEGFTDLSKWILDYNGVDGKYDNVSADDDGTSIVFSGYGGEGFVRFESGKIAMREGNPTLVINVKAEGSKKNRFQVKVITPDGKEKLVKTVAPIDDFQAVKVSLADYTEESFIKVALCEEFQAEGSIWIDALKITDLLEYNLAATIEAPKSVMAGQNAEVAIAVRNIGEKPAKNFTVKLFANEEEILKEEVTEPLVSYETLTVLKEIETSIFDEPGDIALRAEVEFDNDLDLDDNVAETVCTVKQSTAAAPENLKGEKTDNGVKLTWDAPANATEEVVEDFADLEANNITDFGEWTAINNNGATKGALFSDFALASDNKASAFIVIRPSEMGIENSAFAGPNGSLDETYLLSGYNLEGESYPDNDDWLISPALPGVAQTITFAIEALSVQYGPQSYEVYASTSGKAIEDFVKVGGEVLSQTGWKQVSYDLPEGTTYFAIRNITDGNSSLAICVTDFNFSVGGGEVANYNVWVDGEVAESTTETSIELEGASTSSVFAVSAVYPNGAESKPVVFIFSNAGQFTAIESLVSTKKPADIYTLDGKLVRSQATSIEGLRGAYIIEGQKVIVK